MTIPGGTLPTSLAYDAHGNLTTIVDPLQHTTRASYDAASRRLSTTDPRGNLTEFDYDALNSLTAVADALGGVTRFSYDGNGNLLTVTDARSGTTTYTYDVMDRHQTRTDPVGQTEQVLLYDGLGNVLQFRDRKGQSGHVAYDSLNRPLTATWADGTVTAYGWDSVDRLTSVVETRPGPVVTSVVNDFDVLDRLVTQITALGSVSSTYDLASRRQTMNTTTYDWDEASNLKHITRPIPGGNLVASFTYDPVGRRSTRTVTAPTPAQGVSTTYTYDPASQLIGLAYTRNGAPYGDLAYTYDAAGNRSAVGGSLARTLLPDAVSGATYDPANRQTQFGATNMTFDLNGNLQTLSDHQGTTLFWDAQDRLMSLTRGDGLTAAFAYDGLGRRVSKTVNGVTTSYAYDGRNIASTITANGSTDYLMGPPLDEPLARNGGTQFYLADALGSVITVVDATGAGDTTYTYAPFGITSSAGTSSGNPLLFTGREADETGLYYYRARYYHPGFGRFVSEDWLRFASGDVNFYSYVGNRPTELVDPSGNFPTPADIIGGGIAGAMGGGLVGGIEGYLASGNAAGLLSGALAGAVAGAVGGMVGAGVTTIVGGGVIGAYTGGIVGGMVGEIFGSSRLGQGPGDTEPTIRAPYPPEWPEFRNPPPPSLPQLIDPHGGDLAFRNPQPVPRGSPAPPTPQSEFRRPAPPMPQPPNPLKGRK